MRQNLGAKHYALDTVGKRTFTLSGTSFWNSLPPHVTSAPSLAIFRQRLKTFLPRDATQSAVMPQ